MLLLTSGLWSHMTATLAYVKATVTLVFLPYLSITLQNLLLLYPLGLS